MRTSKAVKEYGSELHKKVLKMFDNGATRKQIVKEIGISKHTINLWLNKRTPPPPPKTKTKVVYKIVKEKRKKRKTQRKEIYNRFALDFASGLYVLKEWAEKNNIPYATAKKWKSEIFGKLKPRNVRILEMKKAGKTNREIADFFNISIVTVRRNLAKHKKITIEV